MSEAWRAAFEADKVKVGRAVHEAWAAEKQRQGFADHAWNGDWVGHTAYVQCVELSSVDPFDGTEARCPYPPDLHHPDMLDYDDLAPNIQEYDIVTGMVGYRLGFEAGHQDGLDEAAEDQRYRD